MKSVNVNTIEAFEAYGLQCQSVIPESLVNRPPFGSMRAQVKPQQTSVRHNHHETEVFYLLSGQGRVNSNGEECRVEQGSVILLPAFSEHTITNLSHDENLEFLTFWWEDAAEIEHELQQLKIETNKEILVTATPPTPNGDLHLGHMSGPYLGADIYTRFMRSQGNKVFYLTGSDVNQTYVLTKAMQQDKDPKALAEFNTAAIINTLNKGKIEYDEFYDPYQMEGYNELIQSFFESLHQAGALEEKVKQELFDNDTYLHEAYIKGLCPHCNEPSDGNCCEQCGLPHDTVDLIEPKSLYSSETLTKRSVKKLYFPLENYRQSLLSYIDGLDLMAHHKLFVHELFSKPLPDIAISHPGPWGINHTISGYEDQIIYVWAEMLPGYLVATKQASGKDWQSFDSRVQFFGFDNTFYHLVLFPAMLIALDNQAALPNNFVINEFLQLDGSKFSTSREHLIWANDFCSDKNPDLVRMYLSRVRPEQNVNNFSVEGFDRFVDEFVQDRLLNTVDQFQLSVEKINGNSMPEPGAWNAATKENYRILIGLYHNIVKAHQAESFSTHTSMSSIEQALEVANMCNDMIQFLHQVPDEYDFVRTLLALTGLSLKVVCIGLVGIAPGFASKLYQELGFDGKPMVEPGLGFIPGGQKILHSDAAYFQ